MEHEQQQNGENVATAGAMTLKALSVKLTDEYPAITKRKHPSFLIFYDVDMASVIPGRTKAEKSETTMTAFCANSGSLQPRRTRSPQMTLSFLLSRSRGSRNGDF